MMVELKQKCWGMSITSERAAEVLGMAASFNGCGRSDIGEFREAVRAGKAALREKAERENPKPLTLEELRQMDGEPVWIDDWWEDSHGWELSMDASDYFDGERRTEKEYGSIWVAYRHKPKEVQNG